MGGKCAYESCFYLEDTSGLSEHFQVQVGSISAHLPEKKNQNYFIVTRHREPTFDKVNLNNNLLFKLFKKDFLYRYIKVILFCL